MVAHNNLSLPIGYTRTKTYEDRGTPDKIGEIWEFKDSTDTTKDGLWISTGVSADTDWERITDLAIGAGGITTAMIADGSITNVKLASGAVNDIGGLTLVQGDILYYDGTNIVRLAKGSEDQVLKMTSTIPSWQAEGGGGGGSASGAFVSLYRGTDLSLFPISPAVITWDATITDPDSEHDTSTNPSRIHFVNQGVGTYKIEFMFVTDNDLNNSGDDFDIVLRLNGATELDRKEFELTAGTTGVRINLGIITWYFDISTPLTDYIELLFDPSVRTTMTNVSYMRAGASGQYNSVVTVTKMS